MRGGGGAGEGGLERGGGPGGVMDSLFNKMK